VTLDGVDPGALVTMDFTRALAGATLASASFGQMEAFDHEGHLFLPSPELSWDDNAPLAVKTYLASNIIHRLIEQPRHDHLSYPLIKCGRIMQPRPVAEFKSFAKVWGASYDFLDHAVAVLRACLHVWVVFSF
jgi:hypothetical protein